VTHQTYRPRSTLAGSHGEVSGPHLLAEHVVPTIDADVYDPNPRYCWMAQNALGAPGGGIFRVRRLVVPDNCTIQLRVRVFYQSYRWWFARQIALTMASPYVERQPLPCGPFSTAGYVKLEDGTTTTNPPLSWLLMGSGLTEFPPLQGPGQLVVQDQNANTNGIALLDWTTIFRNAP